MRRRSIVPTLPFVVAIASVATGISCNGRGSGTGQPWYGPGTGPITSYIPNGSTSANANEFLYWVNAPTNDIAIYQVDSQTGCLSPISQNNISTGQGPLSIQAHPDPSKRIMLVGCSSGDIIPYFIDPSGSGNLQPGPSSTNVSNHGAFVQMKFRGDGAYLYVLTNDPGGKLSPSVTSFVVNTQTGAINPPPSQAGQTIQSSLQVVQPTPGLKATSFAIDPNNQFAYVALSNNKIVVLALANDGSLSVVQQTASGQPYAGGAAEPSCLAAYGSYLYEGSLISSSLDFFQVTGGQLALSQNTYDTGGQLPVAMTIPLTGGFLFTCNNQSGDISQFVLGSGNGVLGPSPLPPPLVGGAINPQTGQPGPAKSLCALAVNFSGQFAYSLDAGGGGSPAQISCYQVNGGILSPANASQASGPIGQPFANVQPQRAGQTGGPPPCPDAIIVNHTN